MTIDFILKQFKENKRSVSGIEKLIGVSNGLLGKAAAGKTTLSDEKFRKLEALYLVEIGLVPEPNTTRTVHVVPVVAEVKESGLQQRKYSWISDVEKYCSENSITPQDLIDFHVLHTKKEAEKTTSSNHLKFMKNILTKKLGFEK